MKYNVKITQVLEGYAEIEAENAADAVKAAEELYSGGAELPDLEDTHPLSFCVEPENRKELAPDSPSLDEVENYLRSQGFPETSVFLIRQFVYGGDIEMFNEAVRNNYDLDEVQKWAHLRSILGNGLSFRGAMMVDTALWIEDLDTLDMTSREDILLTPKGIAKQRLEKLAEELNVGKHKYLNTLNLSEESAQFLINAFGLSNALENEKTMDLCIYQINRGRDPARLKFFAYDIVSKHMGGKIDASIYDKVYEGSVNAGTLEDVFYIFNEKHPENYRAHSLSVSDVVEVKEAGESHFYFCDSFGFRRISFDAQLAEIKDGLKPSLDSKINTFSALAAEGPGCKPQTGRGEPER